MSKLRNLGDTVSYYTLIQAAFGNQTVTRSYQVGKRGMLVAVQIAAELNGVAIASSGETAHITIGTRTDLADAASTLSALDGIFARVVLNTFATAAAPGSYAAAFANERIPLRVAVTETTVLRAVLTAGTLGSLSAWIIYEFVF